MTTWRTIAGLLLLAAGATVLARPWRRIPDDRPRAEAAASRHSVRESCAECHADVVESLAHAPHGQTLRRPTAPELRSRLAKASAALGNQTYRFEDRDGQLWFHTSARPAPARVDWLFGSGRHAMTPVTLLEGSRGETQLIQLHASWFAGGQLGVTPGSEQLVEDSTDFGILHHDHEARSCFDCHASHVPIESGRIDFERLRPSIDCDRCHSENAEHARSEGKVGTKPAWNDLTARQSIDRCGECHRRADQFTTDELRPDNVLLLRFAPVGMAMSACFRANEDPRYAGRFPRFDCLGCHDPHRSGTADQASYARQCLRCHASAEVAESGRGDREGPAGSCPVEPNGTRCVECHMPRRKAHDLVNFTDHWIRRPADESSR